MTLFQFSPTKWSSEAWTFASRKQSSTHQALTMLQQRTSLIWRYCTVSSTLAPCSKVHSHPWNSVLKKMPGSQVQDWWKTTTQIRKRVLNCLLRESRWNNLTSLTTKSLTLCQKRLWRRSTKQTWPTLSCRTDSPKWASPVQILLLPTRLQVSCQWVNLPTTGFSLLNHTRRKMCTRPSNIASGARQQRETKFWTKPSWK